jgi:hypothetical protein
VQMTGDLCGGSFAAPGGQSGNDDGDAAYVS